MARLGWLIVSMVVLVGPAFGQDPVSMRSFGMGVHHYFSGDYRTAFDLFNTAIDLGTIDPRCYFFRGLCNKKLGRPFEAEEDFKKGAELEVADGSLLFNVSRALERIQGPPRLLIERHRLQARTQKAKVDAKIAEERYGAARAAQQRLLEQQAIPPTPPAGMLPQPSPGAAAGAPGGPSGQPPMLPGFGATPTTGRGPEPLPPPSPPPGGAQPAESPLRPPLTPGATFDLTPQPWAQETVVMPPESQAEEEAEDESTEMELPEPPSLEEPAGPAEPAPAAGGAATSGGQQRGGVLQSIGRAILGALTGEEDESSED